MTLFAIAGCLAPIVGPTLGGYLTVFHGWRWIFYINIPVGALTFVACYALLDDPDYLKKERARLLRGPLNLDYIGLGLLALVMTCWEVMLSKGQEWDWYNDPFWRVQTLFLLFVLGLGYFVFRQMRVANPVVNVRVLGDHNLAASSIIMFCVSGVMYGCTTSLPGLLQTLFGYDAYLSGLVMSPAGVSAMLMLVLAGILLGRKVDARWLILLGLLIMAAGNYWMSQMNLEISPGQVIWPRFVTFAGPRCSSLRSTSQPSCTSPGICAGRRSACSPWSATRGAASARPWPKPSCNAASNSTRLEWANSSTLSIRR